MVKKATAKPILPEWDLSDFYANIDAPEVAADMAKARKLCKEFSKKYSGRIAALSADELAEAIRAYEVIEELLGKLGSYAQLKYAQCMTDPKISQFYQNIQELATELGSEILFFTLSINKIEEKALAGMLQNQKLATYAPWLRDVRSFRPYQLPDDMEKLLLEKQVAGRSAWTRLFDETLTSLTFPFGNKQLSEPEIMEMMSDKDAAKRKEAALSVGEVFKAHTPIFTLITNTLAKDKDIEDRWRSFKTPISSRNVSNYIEDEVVEALLAAVQKSYPNLAHRYYKLKAKWFGKKAIDYWDRNAPLPFADEKTYRWEEAEELVLTSFSEFSPTLGKVGSQFFGNGWIDAPVKPGKSPGAFAHPTVPCVHPYLLLNYLGKSRDVMTLAHELGHGVHQVLAAGQGMLQCDTPLTLAETASVFGEQLTFRRLVACEKNPEARKALIAAKVEDMLNTVVRQIAFCQFEKHLHDSRKQGELTSDQIGEIWMQAQAESLGPAIRLHGNYQYFWSYIPHFIHTPFYVYAYAFGDCLVNSLYAVYEKEAGAGRAQAFEKKYLAMLEAGGTLRHKELLKPFGLDASHPDFWMQGLDVISGFIDELE